MECLPQFPACPSLLWDSFPGCPVGIGLLTAQFSKSNTYFLSTDRKVLQLLKSSKAKWTALSAVERKMSPFLLVSISKSEWTKIQDHREKGPHTFKTHQKGNFPEKENIHRYSLNEHVGLGEDRAHVVLALKALQSGGQAELHNKSVSKHFEVKDRCSSRNRSWRQAGERE